MGISELFIRRPIATTLSVMAILIFGLVGYNYLPVNDLPSVEFPTINVMANLPGANPDTMAAAVALPLEKQFATIPNDVELPTDRPRPPLRTYRAAQKQITLREAKHRLHHSSVQQREVTRHQSRPKG